MKLPFKQQQPLKNNPAGMLDSFVLHAWSSAIALCHCIVWIDFEISYNIPVSDAVQQIRQLGHLSKLSKITETKYTWHFLDGDNPDIWNKYTLRYFFAWLYSNIYHYNHQPYILHLHKLFERQNINHCSKCDILNYIII